MSSINQEQIRDCGFGLADAACDCGCGDYAKWLPDYKKYNRFINGHNSKGKNNNMYGRTGDKAPSFGIRGSASPNWKGNNVTLTGLHKWIRRYISPPKNNLCQVCNQRQYLDLANISPSYNENTYTRDFDNWVFLCRRCHLKSDNRLAYLQSPEARKKSAATHTGKLLVDHSNTVCAICTSDTTYLMPTKRPLWYLFGKNKSDNLYICHKCYEKNKYYSRLKTGDKGVAKTKREISKQ